VSLLLARLIKLLVDDGKHLSDREDELKNSCLDYSVQCELLLTKFLQLGFCCFIRYLFHLFRF